MSLFQSKPKAFHTAGKPKLQFIVDAISQYDEGPYTIAGGSYTDVNGEIEAGHSIEIHGVTKKYWRSEEIVRSEGLHISVKLNSNPIRHRLETGVIGGGVFQSAGYLEVELNVEPRCVKDVLDELRREPGKGFRIDGYAISEKVFRVAYFLLFAKGAG